MGDWRILACCNDRATLAANLAASDDVRRKPDRLLVEEGAPSASIGVNALMGHVSTQYCVVAHQDVYLPNGWIARLLSAIRDIESRDSSWGVIGVYGVRPNGGHVGRVWSSGLGREIGAPFVGPIVVGSLDELVLVINQAQELRFDERLPGFHLYGTDIVQTSLSQGRSTYVVDAPVVHNSLPVRSLSGDYMTAYRYMIRKWRAQLPIFTPVAPLQRPAMIQKFRNLRRSASRITRRGAPQFAGSNAPRPDPAAIARRLGYE